MLIIRPYRLGNIGQFHRKNCHPISDYSKYRCLFARFRNYFRKSSLSVQFRQHYIDIVIQ